MRIAFFHNWSWLGAALARSLIGERRDDLWIVGAPAAKEERDPELTDLARRNQALVISPRDVGASAFIRRLDVFRPDLIVVGTFPKRLSRELIAVPRLGAINVHVSLLPAYRGALPEFWVIRNGERETGVSIHEMTEEFDAGPILVQESVPIQPDDTLLSLTIRLNARAAPLLLGLLARYRAGERPVGEPQDDRRSSIAPRVRDQHLAIDWFETSASIDRLVRAASPVFDVHTSWRGRRVVVRAVDVLDGSALELGGARLPPGCVHLDPRDEVLLVGTKDGIIALRTVELSSEPCVGGFAFATRYGLRSGERLGAAQ